MQWLNALLFSFAVFLSCLLLFDHGGLLNLYDLKQLLEQQKAENLAIKERIDQLKEEADSLKISLDAVEEIAREEMGLIRPGEIFIRVLTVPPDHLAD